jgi:hypothetical protein
MARMRQGLFFVVRSILLGWATLLLTSYLLERPLLILVAGRLGASWFPTVRLMLDCSVLVGIGWVIGQLNPTSPILAIAAFATTLSFWDFGELVEIGVPWLLELTANALRDPRYWDSLVYTAVVQTLLFGSLIVGALLSRRAPTAVTLSIR